VSGKKIRVLKKQDLGESGQHLKVPIEGGDLYSSDIPLMAPGVELLALGGKVDRMGRDYLLEE